MAMDLTVRLGDLLTMIGLFAGGIAVVFMQRADMRILAGRVESVENSMKIVADKLNGITDILVQQAKHDQRLLYLEENIRVLQHGTAALIEGS